VACASLMTRCMTTIPEKVQASIGMLAG